MVQLADNNKANKNRQVKLSLFGRQ